MTSEVTVTKNVTTVSVDDGTATVDVTPQVTEIGIGVGGLNVTGTVTSEGLVVDTNTLYVDSTNNRVGIGSTSPDSTLHVNGVLTALANPVVKKNVPVIEFRSPNGTNGMNIKANLNDSVNYGLQFEDKDGNNRIVISPLGDVSFYNETDDSTAKFRWDASTEKLGIGTTSPNRQLHVSGSGTTVAAKVEATDGNQSSLDLQNTEGWFRLINDGGSLSVYDQADSAERFRINTSGNVGIGTSDPTNKLHVNGTVKADTHFTSSDSNATLSTSGDGGAVRLRPNGIFSENGQVIVDTSGNVGIGTSSPTNKLHVDGGTTGTNVDVFKLNGANSAFAIRCSNLAASSPVWTLRTFSGETLAFGDGNTENMRIDPSGNVGIGTSEPLRELEVTGTGNVYARITAPTDNDSAALELKNTQETWQIRNEDTNDDALEFIDDTATRLTIKKDGNVGIGTSSPTEILDIDGDSIRLRQSQTPASATATGTQGQIAWDANYMYVCTATNTWKRVALATW